MLIIAPNRLQLQVIRVIILGRKVNLLKSQIDMDINKPTPFQFQNQRQAKIYNSLKRFVAEAPASFYKDACKIMQDNCNLETKTNLIGHLLREIFGWLTDLMLPISFSEPTVSDKYKQKIMAIVGFYSIDENHPSIQFWLSRIAGDRGLHTWAHRESMEVVRPTSDEFQEIWEGTELLLDFLLGKIEGNYLLYTRQIDTIISRSAVSEADIKSIKEHIPANQTTHGYFFDKLQDPNCLSFLQKQDFFRYPRKPLQHEDGGVSFPWWPQMGYLARMAKIPAVQDQVLKICLDIETDNITTQVQILEIALSLPPDKALEIVKKSYNWFNQINSWFHPEKFGQLMTHLQSGGYRKETLELARKLLAIKPDPRKPTVVEGYTFPHDPIALFDDWHYEKILKEDYPSVVDSMGMDAVNLLLDLIEGYIDLSDPDGKKRHRDTSSVIWRPAIEDNSQNHKFGVRDLLVTGARDATERFLQEHPEKIMDVITELEKRKLNIFKRLSLHLLRLFPKGAEAKIISELLNKEEFDGQTVRLGHEYYLLAETHGKLLNTTQREQIWSWIMTSADEENYKEYKRKTAGRVPPDDEIKRYEYNWQMYHLIPYKSIDPKWEEYFGKLRASVGQPEFPSFSSWMRSGSFGPASSISSEQIKSMEPAKVVDYLKKWEPPANDPLDRSREGTGRELAVQITADPDKWLKSAPSFDVLDPTYVRSFLSGYRESLKQGKKFDWRPILQLCKSILKKPIKIEGRQRGAPFGNDPDWGWCRNTIAELIDEGLGDHPGKLSLELRKEVWQVIKQLTDDPSPTPEQEKEQLNSHSDPLSVAINTTRGDAMDTAIQYGIWLKEGVPKEKQKDWSLEKDAPELFGVLNGHLDINIDPSIAIRSVYGQKLGALVWLDRKWVLSAQDAIFPLDENKQDYFNAAWETYITFVHPFNDVYALIEKQYRRAVRELGRHTDQKHHLENPDERLAQHLMAFYWSGVLDFSKTDSLLIELYQHAPIGIRQEIIQFLGINLKDAPDVTDEARKRLIYLLESRLAIAKKSGDPKNDSQEFQGFGWWLYSGKLPDNWCLKHLIDILKLGCDLEGDHFVMEKFIELVETYPLEVIQCSKMMVENDRKGWGVAYWRDELRTVIEKALKSANQEAIKNATEFVNVLVARGSIDFAKLLN